MAQDDDDNVFVDAVTLTPELVAAVARRRDASAPATIAPPADPPGGLTRWGADITVRRGPCVVDLSSMTTKPVTVPGLDKVRSVAGDAIRYAIGLRRDQIALLRERGETWEPLSLPPGAHTALGEQIKLYAGGESLAVTWHRAGQWQTDWWNGERWIITGRVAPHVVVSLDRIWLGYGNGEWGGFVESMSSTGATFDRMIRTMLPVQALVASPGGAVLVGASLAHLGARDMYVGMLAPDGTQKSVFVAGLGAAYMALVAARNGESGSELEPELLRTAFTYERTVRPVWDLPPDTLEDLDVDAQGRLYLLTSRNGVIRVDGETLTRLTPPWPHRMRLDGAELRVQHEVAVVSGDHVGLFLCRLGTNEPCYPVLPA